MTKRLLIDASHAEETRVVVLDGNRLEDFDVETAARKQIKGNIYLAKVIRVEPSLQAAFVEYGGNRHGFLAFGEIHPDYYQIPVADRQRLLEEQARAAEAEAETDEALDVGEAQTPSGEDVAPAQPLDIHPIEIFAAPPPEDAALTEIEPAETEPAETEPAKTEPAQTEAEYAEAAAPSVLQTDQPETDQPDTEQPAPAPADEAETAQPPADPEDSAAEELAAQPEAPAPESLGGEGDDDAEARERRQRQRFLRNYKIQEVVHRRQIMLIQVVKEERGNKGAALTTYLSLAGRFSVLMPNSPTGGGVSRKITSVADRRRLKEAMNELDVPAGMGLIVRTAGANRPKPEIKRDCEYLLRLWDDIRDKTMQSIAPALIYEEASLIKRTIRDVYTRDVEDVLVDGAEGFRAAQDFMRMLMPAHARKVQLWTEGQPLFARYQVENQLDAMLNPTVQLRSGGYIVINQTEALVAIDVNSGRSTRERSVEDTAARTNLEAADEVARQVRMRDLAGLIVIDFIDMESRRNNLAVERRMKEALRNDRARIQIGNISHFGLMEMSRQRLRPSLAEASLVLCPHCAGMGHIRSPESAALHVLRAIEDEGAKLRAAEIAVHLPPEIALYLFNHKRDRLSAIEARYLMRVTFHGEATLTAGNFRIDKLRDQTADALPAPAPAPASAAPVQPATPVQVAAATPAEVEETENEEPEAGAAEPGAIATETGEDADRKRRRRRRRGKRRPEQATEGAEETTGASFAAITEPSAGEEQPSPFDVGLAAELSAVEASAEAGAEPAKPPARRRRSRGGRRRPGEEPAPTAPEAPVYIDIADIFEAAERAETETRTPRPARDPVFEPELPLDPDPAAVAADTDVPNAASEPPSPPVAAPEAAAPRASPTPALDQAMDGVAAITGAAEAATDGGSEAPVTAEPEPDSGPEPGATGAQPTVPAFGPTIIGIDAPAGEKKSGWWRR